MGAQSCYRSVRSIARCKLNYTGRIRRVRNKCALSGAGWPFDLVCRELGDCNYYKYLRRRRSGGRKR